MIGHHPFRFPILLSLILALCLAGPVQAQQTFFIDTVAGPSWPYPAYPNSVAVASDGTIYLANRSAHTVLQVATDGSVSVFAGTGSTGFSGDNDVATVAQLNTPTGVAVTTLGDEFVHDAHRTCTVPDFPLPDHSVNLVWQEAGQHFALSDGHPSPPVVATHASDVLGRLETPAPGSFQSGRGVISGWVCDAAEVSIEIDGTPYPVAYGTARADTAAVCENPAPGFGLSLDWNRLGPGDHEVVALADGAEFGRVTVQVTTLGAAFVRDAGSAFVRGLAGECVVEDFPAPGEAVSLEWQEATQNFVITGVE